MTDQLRQAVARALIDADPTMSGYHQTHIDIKLPAADAAIAEIRKALAPTLAALQPFAEFAHDRFPPDMVITQGSPIAKRQLTMGHCQNAKRMLAASPIGD